MKYNGRSGIVVGKYPIGKEEFYMEQARKTGTSLAYGWLVLAVFSLVFAGIFALLVALARTPGLEEMLPLGRDYIYVALVGHVVLAVVIWFLAFKGFLWVYSSSMLGPIYSAGLGWAGLGLSAAGMGLVVISAVFGLGAAELANYVPVLLTPWFYAGLILFAAGILLNLINTFLTVMRNRRSGLPVLTMGMLTAGAAVIVAFICFALSGWFQYSTDKMYLDFERLMWGGGHILQFANSIAMATVWVLLVKLVLKRDAVQPGSAKALYALVLLFIIPAPAIFFFYDTSSQAYKDSFTWLMQWGIGPSIGLFMLAAMAAVVETKPRPWKDPAFSSLVLSIAIFLTGGLIGASIGGVNTIIPAHYHCVIGAVTIAFMGLFYEVLPEFDRALWSRKLAVIQPYLYSLGILLFALGLFMAGSHGVARKTYGAEQNLDNMGKLIGMSIMGIGGLVAIAGGITFVWNAIMSLFGRKAPAAEASLAVYRN